jgi:single-strand DNA-binding protein
MSSLNEVRLIGNLGRDPEVRTTQAGDAVVTLSVATSEQWKDKNTGERKERTEWHRVVIFNQALCNVAEQYLRKGSKVFLGGKMQTRKWTDQQGVERYTTEIVLGPFDSRLVLLDGKTGGGGVPPAGDPDDYGTTRSRDSGAGGQAGGAYDGIVDEIPF